MKTMASEKVDGMVRRESAQDFGAIRDVPIPRAAKVPNQSSMMGPKRRPTLPVPRRWMAKRPIRIMHVRGTTQGLKALLAIVSPSTALSTEMAGVITPSPTVEQRRGRRAGRFQ